MYADEGTLILSDVSIKCMVPNLQHDLTIVDKWCTLNNMAINPSKTVLYDNWPTKKTFKTD